jgi:transketolase
LPDLRKPFVETLIKLAEHDKSVTLIVCDVGHSFAEPFIKKYPSQYLNSGTMEATTVGIAAGMAMAGKKPYVYTVVNFLLFRAWEQVRNDIAYQNTNVKLIGVRGKESYKFLGFSHNIIEDEDIMMTAMLPNILSFTPHTTEELAFLMHATYGTKAPTYIRL